MSARSSRDIFQSRQRALSQMPEDSAWCAVSSSPQQPQYRHYPPAARANMAEPALIMPKLRPQTASASSGASARSFMP